MGNSQTNLIFFSAFVLMVLRGYMSLEIRLNMTKRVRKEYHKNTSFIKRWFFIDASKYIKNKHSKIEGKAINTAAIVGIFSIFNTTVHSLLAVEIIMAILHWLGCIEIEFFHRACLTFFVASATEFVIISLIEFFSNRKYHIKRYHK